MSFKERENGLNELSRRRERDATQREVDKLRASIQTLTRSANPLGKLMDFLQEDVDSMQVNDIVVYIAGYRPIVTKNRVITCQPIYPFIERIRYVEI